MLGSAANGFALKSAGCGKEYGIKMKNNDFIEQAFQKLRERGWLEELVPSAITKADIAKFEQERQIKLPALFKAYLTAYKLPYPPGIVGLVYDDKGKEIRIDTIDWHDLTGGISDLSEDLNCFREEFEDWDIPLEEEKYKNLFPIGYMDGWYCLDLSRTNGDDCPVVFLEYGGEWNGYYDADGILHGECVAPSFRTLLEWYFCGSLEKEYEKQNHVTVNYEFYKAWHRRHFIYFRGQ